MHRGNIVMIDQFCSVKHKQNKKKVPIHISLNQRSAYGTMPSDIQAIS